jgi:lipopolysaccharide export LptBFGC system permease protein LptF
LIQGNERCWAGSAGRSATPLSSGVLIRPKALLEPWLNNADRRAQDVAAGARLVIPLGLAFLIGFWLRTWWWTLSPFLVIVVTMLAFSVADYLRRSPSQRQQVAAGLIVAIAATELDAGAATLAAIVGLVVGRWWHGG